MKKPFLLGTNLKMNKTAAELCSYLQQVDELCLKAQQDNMRYFVIPSFTALPDASRLNLKQVRLGAQNMCWEDQGEYTGEISPVMLNEFDIDLVELGHSERRNKFGETDEMINKKVLAALRHNMTALMCIGETREELEAGETYKVLRRQITQGLQGVSGDQLDKIWIAYEPVWAIGVSGRSAPASYVQEAHKVIRTVLCELYGDSGKQIPLLFGGSVNPANAASYCVLEQVDGLFVGRAVWTPKGFSEILHLILE